MLYTADMVPLAYLVRDMRSRGLSDSQIARLSGDLTRSTIFRIRTGRTRRTHPDTAAAVMRAYRASVGEGVS